MYKWGRAILGNGAQGFKWRHIADKTRKKLIQWHMRELHTPVRLCNGDENAIVSHHNVIPCRGWRGYCPDCIILTIGVLHVYLSRCFNISPKVALFSIQTTTLSMLLSHNTIQCVYLSTKVRGTTSQHVDGLFMNLKLCVRQGAIIIQIRNFWNLSIH